MSRHTFATILAGAALAINAGPVGAETPAKTAPLGTPAVSIAPPPPLWDFALGAGWGGRIPNTGHVDSWLVLPGMTFRANDDFNSLVNQATVDLTVVAPWELTANLKPFVQIGGSFPVGSNGKTGGAAGIPGITGLAQAEIEQDNIFDLMFGIQYGLPCATFDGMVNIRPMVGFEVDSYTNRLWINETAFINPLTGAPYPLSVKTKSQNSVNPVVGLQLTFPLYNPIADKKPGQVAPWSLDARLSGAYSFDTSGNIDINTTTPGGFPTGSSASPGDQVRVGAALEFHFNSDLFSQGLQARYINYSPR